MGERLRGLLGRSTLADDEGMLIAPCNAIHTFAMRFAIDAVFIDRGMRVVAVKSGVGPSRIVAGGAGAYAVIELKAGGAELLGIRTGDVLRAEEAVGA